jgi:carbon storage regulator CsrA
MPHFFTFTEDRSMLVLSRKRGEALTLKLADGSEIQVVVSYVKGKRVGIGIVAATAVRVLCAELKLRDEGSDAA